jgi:hypothetical protein
MCWVVSGWLQVRPSQHSQAQPGRIWKWNRLQSIEHIDQPEAGGTLVTAADERVGGTIVVFGEVGKY